MRDGEISRLPGEGDPGILMHGPIGRIGAKGLGYAFTEHGTLHFLLRQSAHIDARIVDHSEKAATRALMCSTDHHSHRIFRAQHNA